MDRKPFNAITSLSEDSNIKQRLTVFKFRAPNCKFSRADRFSPRRFSLSGEYTMLPSSIGSGRKTSFGYGKRYVLQNKAGGDAPPCNAYNIVSCFDKITGGAISPLEAKRQSYSPQRNLVRGRIRISSNKTRSTYDESPCLRSIDRLMTPGARANEFL